MSQVFWCHSNNMLETGWFTKERGLFGSGFWDLQGPNSTVPGRAPWLCQDTSEKEKRETAARPFCTYVSNKARMQRVGSLSTFVLIENWPAPTSLRHQQDQHYSLHKSGRDPATTLTRQPLKGPRTFQCGYDGNPLTEHKTLGGAPTLKLVQIILKALATSSIWVIKINCLIRKSRFWNFKLPYSCLRPKCNKTALSCNSNSRRLKSDNCLPLFILNCPCLYFSSSTLA